MEKKICSKCGIEQDVSEFYADKSKVDGFYSCCKTCKKNYFNTRTDEMKLYLKTWRSNNPDSIKNYRQKNPNYVKEYYKKNKDVMLSRSKKHYHDNKEKNSEKFRLLSNEYYKKNKDKRLEYRKSYLKNNRKKYNEYVQNKKLSSPIYHLSFVVRNRIRTFLKSKNITKNNSTYNIVGCPPIFLKEHLEKQFTDGMSWENHGLYGWHIDHIIPLASAKTEEEIYKLCHYTNLQPLWAEDNLKKGVKIKS
jgi:hypothetical protein